MNLVIRSCFVSHVLAKDCTVQVVVKSLFIYLIFYQKYSCPAKYLAGYPVSGLAGYPAGCPVSGFWISRADIRQKQYPVHP
jgi:hypothetical protein